VIPLAHWLRDYAGGIGKPALALKAARTAFEHSLSLEDFGAVKPWAGDAWDAMPSDQRSSLNDKALANQQQLCISTFHIDVTEFARGNVA
jgi:hypothetical protein